MLRPGSKLSSDNVTVYAFRDLQSEQTQPRLIVEKEFADVLENRQQREPRRQQHRLEMG
jgi:hypothetical protein